MSIFEKLSRARIYNPTQHPYKHPLSDFILSHEALPGVTNLAQMVDYFIAVLYPNSQDSVDTPADLPAVGNSVRDYRVVNDDGDGKAAGYQWQQREGDVAAKWYKIYDMDWGYDSILSGFLLKTQDLYVYRYGYDDLDDLGAVLTGADAGQHVYGGASANTHLTLHANAGDGVGAQTGFIQFVDQVRPYTDSVVSLGTTTNRFLKVWTDALTSDTLTIVGGSITDSSGAISFDNENLSTTGTLSAGQITGTSLLATGASTLTLDAGSITDSSGAISFDNENLSTTGSVTVGTLVLAAGSITDSSGAIDFSNENLGTTGTLSAGVITGTQLNVDNLRLDGNTISSTNTNGNILLVPDGSGIVDIQKALTTLAITATGIVGVTGQFNADNLRIDGNVISSTDTDGSIDLQPNGNGWVTVSSNFYPTTDGTKDLGAIAARFNKLFLDNAISDGTNEITIANLLTFRAVGSPNSGDVLFWDGSKWVASNPDTEIDHGELSGLGDDDHTQYALLLGRSTGQTLIGGTGASESLTLTSTSHGTKGSIVFASKMQASADDTWDIGDSTHRFKDLYLSGQAIGMRLQNATTAGEPSASASTPGRLYYNTDEKDVMVDLGGTWKKISIEKYVNQDAVTWDGSTASKTYTVSADVSDARLCHWALYSNSATFEQVYVKITKSQTQVTVTAQANLPAGTYTLIGIG